MKILQLTQSFLPNIGGMEWLVHHLSNELIRRGHEVVVMAAKNALSSAPEPIEEFGPLYKLIRYRVDIRFGSLLGRTPRAILAIMKELRGEFPFEIIHAHAMHYPGYMAMRGAKAFGVPALVTEHGQFMLSLIDKTGIKHKPLIRRRTWQTIHGIDAVTAPNEEVLGRLKSYRHREPDLSRCIPNGIAVPPRERVDALIEENRAGAGRILMVGRNDPVKSYETAIRALAILREGGADVTLRIVGRNTETLVPLIESLRLGGRVELAGARLGDDLWREYAAADLYWMTSVRECQSLVKLEAMSFGLPGVFNDAPGVRDDIEPGNNGLIFDANDPADLARKTLRLLGDANLRRKIGSGARAIGDRYRWSSIIGQYEKLYAELIQSAPRR